MQKIILSLVLLFTQVSNSQEITLNHNIGNTIIDQISNFTCTGGGVAWAREFVLEEFDITGEYTITSGSFGVEFAGTATGMGAIVNVYEIDEGFPGTFDENLILGSTDFISITPSANTIYTFDFPEPIVLSPDIDRILVEVRYPIQNRLVFIGGEPWIALTFHIGIL